MESITVINEAAIHDFINHGITSPGSTFFKKPSKPILCLPNKETVRDRETDVLCTHIYKSLVLAIEDILRNHPIHRMAVSGGMDSRLLLSILIQHFPEQLKNISLYTRWNPNLGKSMDRDFLLIQQFCKEQNLDLQDEKSTGLFTNHLLPFPEDNTNILTGLWGGELLGGALIQHRPFDISKIINDQDGELNLFFSSIPNIEDEIEQTVFYDFLLLSSTEHSAFYTSLSWFTPYFAERGALSPFLHPIFLKSIFSVPPKLLINYSLYNKMADLHMKDFIKIPVNNLDVSPKFSGHIGKNPEFHPNISSQPAEPLTAEQIQLIEHVKQQEKAPYSQYFLKIIPALKWLTAASSAEGLPRMQSLS